MATLMENDALMELGAHVAALISRSIEYVEGVSTPDQVAIGKLRGYVRGTNHAEIDGSEVSALFQNIRRKYEAVPAIVQFEACDDMTVIYQRIEELHQSLMGV